MTVYPVDALTAFGNLETVEVPGGSALPSTANDATQKAPLGILYRFKGLVFRYVRYYAGSPSPAQGASKVGYWYALDPVNGIFTVSCDVSACIAAGVNLVAGVFGGTVTNAYFTWVHVAGVVDALCAANVVASDKLIYGGDGAFARNAAGVDTPDVVFAVALGTVDPTSLVGSVLLQNLNW